MGDRFSRRETDARDETARSNRCARVGVIIDRAPTTIRRARGDDAANVFRRAFDADARSTMDDDAMDDVIARRRDATRAKTTIGTWIRRGFYVLKIARTKDIYHRRERGRIRLTRR